MNTPAPKPTHLRDARLRQALEHAPDAQAVPSAATRAAILRQAHQAVAPVAVPAQAARKPWWQRLVQSAAPARQPWNAGFATVLLACVVAGLWWERDVPDPQPEADMRGAPPAAMQVPAPSAPQTPPPGLAQEDTRAQQPRAKAADALPSRSAEAAPESAAKRTPTDTPQEADRSRTANALPPSAPRAADMRAPATGPTATAWTALQRLPGTAPARARGSLPVDVQQAIDDVLRTGATAVPADDPVLLQITLQQEGGVPLGLLELGSHSLRWTPAEARAPRAFAARVDPTLSLRLREELAR